MTSEPHPLRKYREMREPPMSREELATQLGVSVPTIHRWEAGVRRIDVDLLERVATVTGIPAAVLRPDLAKLFDEVGP